MHPILAEIGGFELHTYGAMGAIGFLYVAWVGLRDAERKGWSRDRIVDVIFYTALVGILGARVVFFLQNPDAYEGVSSVFAMRSGGMVFYGAPMFGVPVAVLLMRRYGLPAWDVFDTFARSFPVAHGLARLGCLGAGCCYGLPTDVSWAIVYDHPLSAAPRDIAVHPTQLYEALGLFGIGAALSFQEGRKRFAGQITLGYLGSYAILRMVTELFRGDAERRFVPIVGLSTSQAISVVILLGAAWAWRHRVASLTEEQVAS